MDGFLALGLPQDSPFNFIISQNTPDNPVKLFGPAFQLRRRTLQISCGLLNQRYLSSADSFHIGFFQSYELFLIFGVKHLNGSVEEANIRNSSPRRSFKDPPQTVIDSIFLNLSEALRR
jgi:hypothetical protein